MTDAHMRRSGNMPEGLLKFRSVVMKLASGLGCGQVLGCSIRAAGYSAQVTRYIATLATSRNVSCGTLRQGWVLMMNS